MIRNIVGVVVWVASGFMVIVIGIMALRVLALLLERAG